MKRCIILTAVAGSLVLGTVALAAPGPGGPRGHGRGGSDHAFGRFLGNSKLVEKLELSSGDVEALRTLRYEAEKSRISLQADVTEAKLELRYLLHSDEPSESAVMVAIEGVGDATVALRKSDIKHMLKARAIMGPDKWKQMKGAMRKSKLQRFRKRHGSSGDRRHRRQDREPSSRRRPGPGDASGPEKD